MPKIKSLVLILGVLIMSFLVGYLVFAAWTEPTAAPPGANVPAPINVGTTTQTKASTLTINPGELQAQLFRDIDAGGTWYVNPSGISVFSGNVGIGTADPGTAKLNVQVPAGSDALKINTFKFRPISATEMGVYDSGGNQVLIFDEGL